MTIQCKYWKLSIGSYVQWIKHDLRKKEKRRRIHYMFTDQTHHRSHPVIMSGGEEGGAVRQI